MGDYDSESNYSSSDSECGWDREGYDVISYASKFLGDLIWGTSEETCKRGNSGGSCGRRDVKKSNNQGVGTCCKKNKRSSERGSSNGGGCGCSNRNSSRNKRSESCGRGPGGSTRASSRSCGLSSGPSCGGGGTACSRGAGRSPGAGAGACSRNTRGNALGRSPGSKPKKHTPSRNNCCYK